MDTYTAWKRPFYRVIGSPTSALTEIHEGYDGSTWEYYPDPGIVVRTIGPAARATRDASLNFIDRIVDAKAQGTRLSYQGERTFNGHRTYIVRAKLADGFTEDLFLDEATYMIDGREEYVPMHAFGKVNDTNDVYEDFRPEGGVMMAHRDAEIDAKAGRVLDEGTLTSVEINPDLPNVIFSPPEWQRTPLQTMIDLIYKERDGADSVLATYRSFSDLIDIHAGATGDAVDFVGYQCLKMHENATAVLLLRENVHDHALSARAHFGLGRALQASGDIKQARAEFIAALVIDPKYSRARAALNETNNLH